jgi:hypothetical protein
MLSFDIVQLSNIFPNLYNKQMYHKKILPGWKYYTYVKPNKNKLNDPLIKAFDLFLKEVILDKEEILKFFNNGQQGPQIKRIIIDTNGPSNNITIKNNDFTKNVFYKDRFLTNRKFKQTIIDHYNSLGIFVKGPCEIIRKDNTSSGIWIVELSKIFEKTDV